MSYLFAFFFFVKDGVKLRRDQLRTPRQISKILLIHLLQTQRFNSNNRAALQRHPSISSISGTQEYLASIRVLRLYYDTSRLSMIANPVLILASSRERKVPRYLTNTVSKVYQILYVWACTAPVPSVSLYMNAFYATGWYDS